MKELKYRTGDYVAMVLLLLFLLAMIFSRYLPGVRELAGTVLTLLGVR